MGTRGCDLYGPVAVTPCQSLFPSTVCLPTIRKPAAHHNFARRIQRPAELAPGARQPSSIGTVKSVALSRLAIATLAFSIVPAKRRRRHAAYATGRHG